MSDVHNTEENNPPLKGSFFVFFFSSGEVRVRWVFLWILSLGER